jgi:hypothetical protein
MNSLHSAALWNVEHLEQRESSALHVHLEGGWHAPGAGKWSKSSAKLEQTWKPLPPRFIGSGASGAVEQVEQDDWCLLHLLV